MKPTPRNHQRTTNGDCRHALLHNNSSTEDGRYEHNLGIQHNNHEGGKEEGLNVSICRSPNQRTNRPTYAKVINMVEGINDVEEERYINSNKTLIVLFEIDMANRIQKYDKLEMEAKKGLVIDTEQRRADDFEKEEQEEIPKEHPTWEEVL